MRNRFLARFFDTYNLDITPSPQFDASALRSDNRTLDRNLFYQRSDHDVYATNLDLTGKLDLWGTKHEILVGFDYYRSSEKYHARGDYETGIRRSPSICSTPATISTPPCSTRTA